MGSGGSMDIQQRQAVRDGLIERIKRNIIWDDFCAERHSTEKDLQLAAQDPSIRGGMLNWLTTQRERVEMLERVLDRVLDRAQDLD